MLCAWPCEAEALPHFWLGSTASSKWVPYACLTRPNRWLSWVCVRLAMWGVDTHTAVDSPLTWEQHRCDTTRDSAHLKKGPITFFQPNFTASLISILCISFTASLLSFLFSLFSTNFYFPRLQIMLQGLHVHNKRGFISRNVWYQLIKLTTKKA